MVGGTKSADFERATEMTDQETQPTISLCNADPKASFSDELADAWSKGKFTDAAVAFLTEGGVDFFTRNCLNHQDRKRCRLCFTVQCPTDLDAVAQLSPLLGPNLRIHLGAKTPVEFGTDVTPMMHSKVIYTDTGEDTCTVFVGSHNWTANALNGVNCEASIRVECSSSQSFAVDVRQHLEECARLCIPFNPNDIPYYKAVQRALSTARPPAPDAEDVTAFEKLPGSPVVVIHAEGEDEQSLREKIMLFLPVHQRGMAKWFSTTTPTTVLLFLYPMETLIGKTPPTACPVLFTGSVGTNNDVSVSPSRETDVTNEIRGFDAPTLQEVEGGNIPDVEDELYQVVSELRRLGPADVPIYHRGKKPVLEVSVRFGESQSDEAGHVSEKAPPIDDLVGEYDDESMRNGMLVFNEPSPERVMRLDVPERWLYAHDVEAILRQRLARNLIQDGVRIALKPLKAENAYIYKATFVLHDGS